jgi:hypothetical protein
MAVMAAAYLNPDPADIPHASSTTRIASQLGGSFGAAALAVILQWQAGRHTAAVAFDHAFWWALAFTRSR